MIKDTPELRRFLDRPITENFDGTELLFEPYPYEENRGEWGRWQVGCEICGSHHVPARFCWRCFEFECYECHCTTEKTSMAHLKWLYDCAAEHFRSKGWL